MLSRRLLTPRLRSAGSASALWRHATNSTSLSRPFSTRLPTKNSSIRSLLIGTTVLGASGTALYYTNDDARHVMVAISRCSTAGWIGIRVAADYQWTLMKTYPDEDSYRLAKRACDERCAERVLHGLQSLGGIYIKLGQHVASMVYILPPEWTNTMAVLQDRCEPTPEEDVRKLFLTDYGEPIEAIFDEFEWKPIGVASLAQVHRARLRPDADGKRQGGNDGWVAVKLQHPALDDFCKIDMETVSFIFKTIKSVFPEFGFDWLAVEMRESLPKELNFEHEAENSRRVVANFADDMAHNRTALKVPKIVWARRRILCMEFVEGARIDNLAYLKLHNIDPNLVSAELTKTFSKMIFLHGFVHCDPHPGNVIVRPVKDGKHGHNFDLVLLDHGLYREIPDQLRLDYAHLWTSIIRGDEEGIKTYSRRVGGTDMYRLFASILTGREWNTINSADLSSVRTQDELDRMAKGAMELLFGISDILAKLPRIVLLLLKTSDLLRHVDEVLRTSPDDHVTYVIMGRYCAKAVWIDAKRVLFERIATLGFSWTLFKKLAGFWWEYSSLAVALWFYEQGATWWRALVSWRGRKQALQTTPL